MDCIKCGKGIPDAAPYCCWCGKKQQAKNTRKNTKRGNGTGSVYRNGDKWVAAITKGYRIEGDKKKRIVVKKCGLKTKKEAIEYLATLAGRPQREKDITWRALYELWLPTHRAGKSTMDCYKSAEKNFAPLEFWKLKEIEIDDLQECLDDCPKGRRTKENMKALCGLMYKYAIPRGYAPLNLAQYLIMSGDHSEERESFNAEQLEAIRAACGKVPYADYIYCMCYLGFRPSEFLALDVSNYDADEKTITGGAKTEAGKNRIVPISKKIQSIISELAKGRSVGALFCDSEGNAFSYDKFRAACFYPAIDAIGIDNPIINGKHKYSPHTCRHTFATLMKRINAPDKDKMKLIGHASAEMLRYYQDVRLADLRRITDVL